MANRNVLENNLHSITQVLNGYDKGTKKRDDLLKAYNKSIKQVPDHYNKEFNNRRIMPTTIAVASKNLVKAVKVKDPKLLKIDAKKYMQKLHEQRKYGLWTLYDYDNDEPVDSDPKKCHMLMVNYQLGLQKDLELALANEREQDNELEF